MTRVLKHAFCGATDNLHFDLSCSKGGSSLTDKNIRLL
jgi:hypothetical protein